MNCQGILAVLEKGAEGTTIAERNAACNHLRACRSCRKMVYEMVAEIPPEEMVDRTIAAINGLASDMADPEWK